jgi:hypothetical protein
LPPHTVKIVNIKIDSQSRPKVIGIVLDADMPEDKPDIIVRWQQLSDKLKKYDERWHRH